MLFANFSYSVLPNSLTVYVLHHPTSIHRNILRLRELLTAYEQRIKGICPVGTVFEEILFRLSQLFTCFVLVEAISPTSNPSSLNSENQVIVILAIKERHETLFPSESLVDEQVLLIMPHRIP